MCFVTTFFWRCSFALWNSDRVISVATPDRVPWVVARVATVVVVSASGRKPAPSFASYRTAAWKMSFRPFLMSRMPSHCMQRVGSALQSPAQ